VDDAARNTWPLALISDVFHIENTERRAHIKS